MNYSSDNSTVLRNRRETTGYEQYFQTEHLKKDLQARSFRGGVVTLGAQGAKFALGLLSTAILARLLRPQDFGLVAMVTSITAFIGLFKDLGLSNATVQRLHITHEQISFLFWINVVLSLATTLLVIALAPVIAWFYHEPRLFHVTLILSLSFVISGLTVQHQALLRRQMQFKSLAVIGPNADSVQALVGNYNGTPSHPVTVLAGIRKRAEAAGITVALELGLVATALAYILFTAALARLPVTWAATGSLAEPLTARTSDATMLST